MEAPVETRRKLNVHKTFRRRPVSTGPLITYSKWLIIIIIIIIIIIVIIIIIIIIIIL